MGRQLYETSPRCPFQLANDSVQVGILTTYKLYVFGESSVGFFHLIPGESLARDQLYLFLTSMFQRFTAHQDPANPNPTLEPKEGLFREPQKYTVVFKDRQ
jgi:hypothetical protein